PRVSLSASRLYCSDGKRISSTRFTTTRAAPAVQFFLLGARTQKQLSPRVSYSRIFVAHRRRVGRTVNYSPRRSLVIRLRSSSISRLRWYGLILRWRGSFPFKRRRRI